MTLGYTGAAVSYSYLLGLNLDFPFLCPVCLEIVSLGSPTEKFIGRTIAVGTVNAALITSAGWVLIVIAFGLRDFLSSLSR